MIAQLTRDRVEKWDPAGEFLLLLTDVCCPSR